MLLSNNQFEGDFDIRTVPKHVQSLDIQGNRLNIVGGEGRRPINVIYDKV